MRVFQIVLGLPLRYRLTASNHVKTQQWHAQLTLYAECTSCKTTGRNSTGTSKSSRRCRVGGSEGSERGLGDRLEFLYKVRDSMVFPTYLITLLWPTALLSCMNRPICHSSLRLRTYRTSNQSQKAGGALTRKGKRSKQRRCARSNVLSYLHALRCCSG